MREQGIGASHAHASPDDWLHALAWAKEGAHPRYGAIWIFCAPHEHPAPSAPSGRKDTASSSTIVCMGAKRCTRRGLRSGSQRERRLGGGKFSLLSLGARKHSLLIARFPCPLNSSARGVLLQVDVVAEAAISASKHRRRCARPTACSFSVGEACMARVWCRGESAWEGSEYERAHNCVFSVASVSWMPLSSPFNTAISFIVSSFCLSSSSSA